MRLKKKFYAVKKGRQTGIFESWSEAQKHIAGFKGSEFKSFLSKQEAEAYLNVGNSSMEPLHEVLVYVDGSYNVKHPWTFCAAFVIVHKNRVLHEEAFKYQNEEWSSARNVAGEIMAVIKALEYCCNKFPKITIFYDYQGMMKWARGEWETKKNLTQIYKKTFEQLKPQFDSITFRHIKAHSGNEWNDRADALAKAALHGPLSSFRYL